MRSFWSHFGVILTSGALLGRSWALLGALGPPLDTFGLILESFLTYFGLILESFWSSKNMFSRDTFLITFFNDFRVHIGPILRQKWSHFGQKKRSERECVFFENLRFSLEGMLKTRCGSLENMIKSWKNRVRERCKTRVRFRSDFG